MPDDCTAITSAIGATPVAIVSTIVCCGRPLSRTRKSDASSPPVCLVTVKGQGLDETALHDLAQFQVRNQIASVPGASVPQPFGGKYRQIMVYVDPYKLEAHQLSLMDVVRSVTIPT